MTNLIECKNLKKSYWLGGEEVPVLRGIDLHIKQGEFVAVIGPSGSGKSTLMHLLGCLDSPSSGEYNFEGHDVARLSEDSLASLRSEKIGFVFQSFNLLPVSVYKNIELPLIYNKKIPAAERRALVEDALHLAQVPENRWKHTPGELSGGQRQRVAIARALVARPALILADEPTGNLDSKTGEMILNAFRDINARGNTIVMITHDLNVAKKADRIVSIQDGLLKNEHN